MLKIYVKTLGAQRVVLTVLVLLVVLSAPVAYNSDTTYEGWMVLPTIIAPALSPILFFLLLLDMLMSKVFMSQHDDAGKKRFRFILISHTVTLAVLLVSWLPFLLALMIS
jgi:hypothetical protein